MQCLQATSVSVGAECPRDSVPWAGNSDGVHGIKRHFEQTGRDLIQNQKWYLFYTCKSEQPITRLKFKNGPKAVEPWEARESGGNPELSCPLDPCQQIMLLLIVS